MGRQTDAHAGSFSPWAMISFSLTAQWASSFGRDNPLVYSIETSGADELVQQRQEQKHREYVNFSGNGAERSRLNTGTEKIPARRSGRKGRRGGRRQRN